MNEEYRAYWEAALEWPAYRERKIERQESLWDGIYRSHETPEWAVDRAEGTGGGWKLLVLAEDWCGDAANSVPVMARLAEAADGIELRILDRDAHPELMDRWLTDGSRSIPIAIALDDDYQPVGRWGPRPAELQAFVLSEKRAGERPAEAIYRDARRWYARDGGETTLHELIAVLEGAPSPSGAGRSG